MQINANSTSVSVYFNIVQDNDGANPGEPDTGLLFSDIETGGSASYMRQGAARVDFTLVTLASASSAYSVGGFIEVDATNMPGVYRCDIPNAAVASGVDRAVIQLVAAPANNVLITPLAIDIISTIPTVTDLTNLPTVPADWLTATGIAANAITAAKIATDAITAAKIATDAIDADAIAADAITAAKIATDAIGTDALATGAIDANAIASNAITAAKIATDAITATKIATDAITAGKIATGAIDADAIAADAITAAKIATGAIDADAIAADAITAAKIATGAISADALATDAITAAKIATDTINADVLATDAVNEIRDAIHPIANTTLSNIPFVFKDSSDIYVTGATGISITRSIDGASFAAVSGTTVSEVGNGLYEIDASATDMNGGKITFRITASGGTPGAPVDRFVTVVTNTGN